MAKGTKKQKELAKEYDNPRIGLCYVPHCKSICPAKGMFHRMCHWHYLRVGFWAYKTGYDLGPVSNVLADGYEGRLLELIASYCSWLNERAREIYKALWPIG